jgi:ketosteroid isomerase-like protein
MTMQALTDRVSLVKSGFEQFAQGNYEPIFSAVSDDVKVRLTIGEGTPLSGVFHGKGGLAEYFARNAALVEPTAYSVLNFLEGGDQVAIVGRESLRIRNTGEVIEDSDWIMLCTFQGDQIIEILVVENMAALENACRPSAVAAA